MKTYHRSRTQKGHDSMTPQNTQRVELSLLHGALSAVVRGTGKAIFTNAFARASVWGGTSWAFVDQAVTKEDASGKRLPLRTQPKSMLRGMSKLETKAKD